MTDASPRIFRNLEKSAGRGDFDDIVKAAVATYGELAHPSETQARDLGRLVLPIFDKVGPETRRSLAAALSTSQRLPRALIDRLLAEPVETAAPFLLASPLLAPADLERLAARGDPRLDRVLARRGAGPADSEPAPDAVEAKVDVEPPIIRRRKAKPAAAAAPDPAPLSSARQSALLSGSPFADAPGQPAAAPAPAAPLPAAFDEAPPRMPPVSRPVRASADEVRETLRRLATSGLSFATPTPADLVTTAMEQDPRRFYTTLARLLPLDARTLAILEKEPTGGRLAVALRALDLPPADVLSVLMMVKPALASDVAAFDGIARFVRALDVEECAAVLRPSPRRGAAPSLVSAYADLDALARAEARPSFGRRKATPAEAKRSGGDRG